MRICLIYRQVKDIAFFEFLQSKARIYFFVVFLIFKCVLYTKLRARASSSFGGMMYHICDDRVALHCVFGRYVVGLKGFAYFAELPHKPHHDKEADYQQGDL